MKQETPKERFEIAKYVLLAVLIVVILGGSGFLFWQIDSQNRRSGGDEYKDARALQSQVDELNKKIDNLNKAIGDAKAQSTVEETAIVSSGQVAGASDERTGQVSGKININSASAGELDSLPGIRATYAQRIIDYRSANGGFKSIEEIQNVKGIGPATFAKMKDQITI